MAARAELAKTAQSRPTATHMMHTTGVLLTKDEKAMVATSMRTRATELLRGVPSTCGAGGV